MVRRWRWLAALALVGAARGAAGTEAQLERGRVLFAAECAGCHGERGDGNGLADPGLNPKPRDLTGGKFKYRSTRTRHPISIDELLTTITRGLPGSAMPSFRYLSEDGRRALAVYVAHLAPRPTPEAVEAVPVPSPPASTPALISEGKEEYEKLGCPACHGSEGRGDGPASSVLTDEWGNHTPARDLTREPMRGGDSARDLYLRLTVGIPGTAMPSYDDVTTPAERQALVAFVRSLRQAPPPMPADPVARGHALVEEKHCTACHLLGGAGGRVAPTLDGAVARLKRDWLERFLATPRAERKLYPATAYRMPDLGLSPQDAKAVVAYLASRDGGSPAR